MPEHHKKSDSEATIRVYNLATGEVHKEMSGIPTFDVSGSLEVIKPVLSDHVAFITQGPQVENQVFMYDTSSGNLVKPLRFSRNYPECFVSTLTKQKYLWLVK